MEAQIRTLALDKVKEKYQVEFAKRWAENGHIGTAELATGVGKNFAAFQCIKLSLESDFIKPGDSILVLAEVTEREKDFFKDLTKFDILYGTNYHDLFDWEFACYQSAYKWEGREFALVIADEIHDSMTLIYRLFYENNSYKGLIGLSAKVQRGTRVHEDSDVTKGILIDKYCPVIYGLNQSEAIEAGVIAGYEILAFYHQLDDNGKTVKGGTKAKPFMTTEKGAYEYVDKKFRSALGMPPSRSKKFLIQRWSRERAKLLYNLPSKLDVVKKIAEIPQRKIIFGNSLDALYKITPNTMSSRLKPEENDEIREAFDSGKIDTIGSFKKLKQGANLSNVKMAVLHSYYSTEVDYIQRLGRTLRLDGDKKALIVVIITMGTQEVKWFDKMTENVEIPVKGFHRIDDLINYINDADNTD